MQIWYPDKDIESFMYSTNAGFECGYAEAPIEIPKNIKDYAQLMEQVHESKNFIDIKDLLCVKYGIVPIIFISCRYFRMPMFPHFWNPKVDK